MSKLYDPFDSILGQILQREIQTKQLVNEHALLPINDYLQRYIFPHFKQKPIQSYLDIAAAFYHLKLLTYFVAMDTLPKCSRLTFLTR